MQKFKRGIALAICLTICLTKSVAAGSLEDEQDIRYVACCVEAEAGNQSELGKRYVVDCILNRFDSGKYETYSDVINEKGQFSCVSNKSINHEPSEETLDIVQSEIESRKNNEILYFRTNKYHSFGTPCFKWQDHYFSK